MGLSSIETRVPPTPLPEPSSGSVPLTTNLLDKKDEAGEKGGSNLTGVAVIEPLNPAAEPSSAALLRAAHMIKILPGSHDFLRPGNPITLEQLGEQTKISLEAERIHELIGYCKTNTSRAVVLAQAQSTLNSFLTAHAEALINFSNSPNLYTTLQHEGSKIRVEKTFTHNNDGESQQNLILKIEKPFPFFIIHLKMDQGLPKILSASLAQPKGVFMTLLVYTDKQGDLQISYPDHSYLRDTKYTAALEQLRQGQEGQESQDCIQAIREFLKEHKADLLNPDTKSLFYKGSIIIVNKTPIDHKIGLVVKNPSIAFPLSRALIDVDNPEQISSLGFMSRYKADHQDGSKILWMSEIVTVMPDPTNPKIFAPYRPDPEDALG